MSTDDTGDLQPLPSDERRTAPVPPGVHEDMLPTPGDLPTTRMRQGYDTEQVDALVEDVFDAVRAGARAPVIAETRFRGTGGLRKGYDERSVDDYLDRLAEAVGQEATPEPSTRTSRSPGAERTRDDEGDPRGDDEAPRHLDEEPGGEARA